MAKSSQSLTMAMDEMDLMNDPKYKTYVKQVDSALKGFEYTSEWADLVNALGKLNKVLQNNTKFPVIPRRFVVGQRLAQCMHPALPSGVHLKALETYDLIFKCIGTDRLVQELSIYSNGLFPLLSHAAINVKPTLLEVYQTHFVPLGERLRPALDGFVIAVLPGLEEGSEHQDTTEKLLSAVCEGVSREFFYAAIWRCILNNPSVRLPGISFVVSQFNKKKSLDDQLYIMGTNVETMVNGICTSLLDPTVLVQRAILDLLIICFPMHNKQLLKQDMISIITAAVTVLLRRDISLDRRLFAWFRNSLDANPTKPSRKGDYYFDKYSKPLLSQAFVLCLTNPSEVISTPNAWSSLGDLWPYRLLICLVGRKEIRKSILDNLSTEVFRALYIEFKNKCNGTEMQRSTNVLNQMLMTLGIAYTWKRLLQLFSESCDFAYRKNNNNSKINIIDSVPPIHVTDPFSSGESPPNEPNNDEYVKVILRKKSRKYSRSGSCQPLPSSPNKSNPQIETYEELDIQPVGSGQLTILEACSIIDFMIDVTAFENDPETASIHLPLILNAIIKNLITYCEDLSVDELNTMVKLSSKITVKIQSPSKDSDSLISSGRGTSSCEPASDALQEIREEAETDSIQMSEGEKSAGISIPSSLASTSTLTPETETASTPVGDDFSLKDSLSLRLDADSSSLTHSSTDPSTQGHEMQTSESRNENLTNEETDVSSQMIVSLIKKLFALFVETRLVTRANHLDPFYKQILFTCDSNQYPNSTDPPFLVIKMEMTSVFANVCQLLVQSSLIPKSTHKISGNERVGETTAQTAESASKCQEVDSLPSLADCLKSGSRNRKTDVDPIPNWLRHLLVLCTFSRDSSVAVSCCSITTYLSLVRILKAQLLDVALPHASLVKSPSTLNSPVLEFTSHALTTDKQSGRSSGIGMTATSSLSHATLSGKSRTSPVGNLTLAPTSVESLITSSELDFITNETSFYHRVTRSLWDNLNDENSSLHLETANLLQHIHNMSADESPVCESVICSSMASADETVSYEARKRFCTLYNITRDIETHSGSLFAPFPRREFDRPLFFMLDSLTYKLDAHNAQAVDWLNQCLKNGDVARILEPLLFILLHPDTARISVQNVNLENQAEKVIDSTNRSMSRLIHQSSNVSSGSNNRMDEAESAAAAAAEARIYAISSSGGNVMYHVNPDGKKRFTGSPVPPNKVVAVTSQGQLPASSLSSSSTSFRNKWVTSRFNVTEYEVPPSHENNIIGGKYVPINMTMNPFDVNGSMSSLASDALDVDNLEGSASNNASNVPVVDFSHVKRFDSLSRKQQPGNSVKTTSDKQSEFLQQDSQRATPTRTYNVNFAVPITLPSPAGTPTPYTPTLVSKTARSSDESESDTEAITHLLDYLVDSVAEEVEDVTDESSVSSASDTTNTRATITDSVSISSWAKPVSVNQLHSHILLYSQVYDSNRTLYALTTLWNIILTDPSKVLFCLATTNISNRLGFRSQELQSLCARHRKSLLGKGFYSSLDTESITAFRSSTFLEVIITTCLYYIRSYYPGFSHARMTESDLLGNQKVRILSCEILRLIFSELIPEIKGKPAFTSYMNDMLMRCKVQKVVLHSLVSSVYNFQFKFSDKSEEKSTLDDSFSDVIVDFNEKISCSTGFQEDMQKSLLKLLEQLMILEHKSSPNAANDRDVPTHNRKGSDSRASRSIRFQPLLSSLKYTPNLSIPCQAMFLSAIQTALQQTSKANLHPNWLQLVESGLPYAGRSLNRMVVCVVIQLCNNIDNLGQTISQIRKSNSTSGNESEAFVMPPNYLISVLKSLGNLCHYCLCDSSPSSGGSSPAMSPIPHNVSGGNSSSLISVNPIQTLSNFLHVFSSENLMTEQSNQSRESSASDPIISTRKTLLTHLPRILSSIRNIWKAVTDDSDDMLASEMSKSWEVMGNKKDVKMAVLDILSPVSLLHGSHFMGAVAMAWYELRDGKSGNITGPASNAPVSSVIPKCSRDQMILVDLIAAVKVLPMDLIIQHVKQVLKQPPQASLLRKKRVALDVCLLQFFLAYIRLHATSEKSHQLLECWKSLISLIKEGLAVSSTQPLSQFHLLAILHEFVQSVPMNDDRQKDRKDLKDQKELQDVAQRLVDACTTVAGARLAQTRWLRRNLEVKPGPQHDLDEDTDGELSDPAPYKLQSSTSVEGETGENVFLAKFSVQALNALAEFVAPILDVVYSSEEKERVVPLVSSIMYFVTPYLKNHSKHNAPSFLAGSHFLSSITSYQYSRKAWRKEAFELLLDPAFFQMEPVCLSYWKVIVDHLMTHDKTTFRDFLSRMSVTQSGSLKLFSSKEQENEQRSQLAKRLAFILFCSEKDQYQRYMPEIQEKLIECLRMNSSPIVQSQILLCFRVLLLRMSHHHLTSLWPFIYTEMFQAFLQIEVELSSNNVDFKRSHSGSQLQKLMNSDSSWAHSNGGLSAPSVRDTAWLQLYLYACKLLDLAIALPADELPQFQMYRWAFVGEPHDESSSSSSSSSLPTSAATTPDPGRNSQLLGSGSVPDRLSGLSLNNNLISDNRQSMKSPSPSPTPSRTSFGSKNQPPVAPILPAPSGPFEPHVVRIEKTMRVKNPNPETLPYSERKPLLGLTSIKTLLDLHPFFHTLVRVTNNAILVKSSPEVEKLTNGGVTNARPLSQLKQSTDDEDPTIAQDRNLEADFLEEIPWI